MISPNNNIIPSEEDHPEMSDADIDALFPLLK
jgi:hypothetical protein